MKIEAARYQLKAKTALNSRSFGTNREGALLKFTFLDDLIGYADCHPWVELGDLSLENQLKLLGQGVYTRLTACSERFARLDAKARADKIHLLANQKIPLSHFLIPNLMDWTEQDNQTLIVQGYTHVKIKLGRQLNQEISHILNLFKDCPLKVRLDFNEILSEKEFRSFLEVTEKVHKAFEFIEDPFPFHPESWKAIAKQYSIVLACDRQVQSAVDKPDSTSFFIIKPAIQSKDVWAQCPPEKTVMTSYLDHPFGQLTAAYCAAQKELFHTIHGLNSHHAYERNVFSQFLSWRGPQFSCPPGTGFGYDEQLRCLQWRSLR